MGSTGGRREELRPRAHNHGADSRLGMVIMGVIRESARLPGQIYGEMNYESEIILRASTRWRMHRPKAWSCKGHDQISIGGKTAAVGRRVSALLGRSGYDQKIMLGRAGSSILIATFTPGAERCAASRVSGSGAQRLRYDRLARGPPTANVILRHRRHHGCSCALFTWGFFPFFSILCWQFFWPLIATELAWWGQPMSLLLLLPVEQDAG